MRVGFHVSIGGGWSKVVDRAVALGCDTLQIFSRNPRGWAYEELDPAEAKEFIKQREAKNLYPLIVHMPYLPNLGTDDAELYNKSVDSLKVELQRAALLGAPYLVMHVGKYGKTSEQDALDRVIEGINIVLGEVKNDVILLLENTAGQGSEVGYTFEQIKYIIDRVDDKSRIGVCFDTAHAFEAGYDLSNKDAVYKTVDEFDRIIGLDKLYVVHLNDSKTPLGSRVDRHWHIGEGYIGREGFYHIIHHPHISKLPGIMETPRKKPEDDKKNMRVIRELLSS